MRYGLIFNIPHALIFLNGDKSSATILAFTQITFFFFSTNLTGNIKFYLKTSSFAAMRAKLGWHEITPCSPILKSIDHEDKEVYALR